MSTTAAPLPLTTVFVPPAGCLETATYNANAIWAPDLPASSSLSPAVLLGATGQAVDLLCYPSAFTLGEVYSPGICPSGWTSACEPILSASVSGTALGSGPATTVQCCPADMTCSGTGWCRGNPSYGPIWSLYTDKYGIEGVMTTTRLDQYSVLAKPVLVAYEPSDQSLLSAAQTAVPQTAQQTSLPNGNQTEQNPSDVSLSSGTIAGIAIGSAAGGIILATVLTFLALRFCLGYRKHPSTSEKSFSRANAAGNFNELRSDSDRDLNELHGYPRATELPARPKHESGLNGLAELSAKG